MGCWLLQPRAQAAASGVNLCVSKTVENTSNPAVHLLMCCDARWNFYECFAGHQCLGVGALSQFQLEKRPWHLFLETTRKDIMVFLQLRHVNFPVLLGICFFLVVWRKGSQRVMMCHAVPDSLGACLPWSLFRRRGHEGSVRSRDTGKRNLESSLHVSWRPSRVDILGVGTTDLSA